MQRKEGMVFSLTDGDRLALLKKKYSYIKDAYELLGMEQIRELQISYFTYSKTSY